MMTTHRTFRWTAAIAALAMMTAFANGCIISSKSRVCESGNRISATALSQVAVGQTTENWLRATLGEPTSAAALDDEGRNKILKYDYTRVESSHGSIFVLFAGSSKSERRETTCFEINDGIVTRYWMES